ncbi:MAG: tRNA guanosine(34) transglycosylase Tgt, partial [Pseudorhodobacter sp.]|nr:tRNA guanosine(34) transglycosylase Tgt [Pseudorhodobacter sp.]
MKVIDFKIEKKLENSLGRAGVLETPHGTILTPAFVVVGTKATVKALSPEQVKNVGVQVVLGNTYHLYLQPGDELIRDAGGLHKFMNWSGPIMTDSGGFQVFSLGVAYGKEISKVVSITDPSLLIPERSSADDGIPRLATIGNDGVSFRSHIDGSLHYITPEKSIEIQHNLGADIIFAFDECTSPTENDKYQEEALSRTHAWAKRSLEEHKKREMEKVFPPLLTKEGNEGRFLINSPLPDPLLSKERGAPLPQALFGIVQGGRSEELRKKSAKIIGDMEFDGFGIGGSFTKEDMSSAVKWVNEVLPEEKPRHLLGIGEPEDLFMGVENGVDLFDCVAPTRIARNGSLYTKNGKINILNAKFVKDFGPIDEGCGCYVCSNPSQPPLIRGGVEFQIPPDKGDVGGFYTRAYLSHLFRAKEMLGATLASIHNVYFINKLVADMRQAILDDKFFEF